MNKTLLTIFGVFLTLYSCSDSKDYSAYFGGEIVNPKGKWVFFYKGENLIDSVPLDENNRFFIRFDSLSPGLYRFKHDIEYQYAYFDKNDSLMVRVNMTNFDQTIYFCGKGDEKNNFLIETYLKNLQDKNEMLYSFDLHEENFIRKADSLHDQMLKFYTDQKKHIKWNNDFDVFAKASIDYPYYSKREFFPIAVEKRTKKTQSQYLSPKFYDYRKNIDFNDEKLADFEVYIQYISFVVDNIANSENNPCKNKALKKLEIIDSITKNQALKNRISSYIAFRYLLDDQKNAYDTAFLEKYNHISTDTEKKYKINHIANSIKNLSQNNKLPNIVLIDSQNNKVNSDNLFHKKTILYFWSQKNDNHFFSVHKKLNKIIEKHPYIDLISVNIDENQKDWKLFLEKNRSIINPKTRSYQALNPQELIDKWVIMQETRALVIDKNAKINKSFANIFDSSFEKDL